MSKPMDQTYTTDEVKHAFKLFEGKFEDQSGTVNLKKLEAALLRYSKDKPAVTEVMELLRQVSPPSIPRRA